MRLLDNLNFDFLGKRKIAFMISATLIGLSLISLLFRGLELGIDFKGGTEIALNFDNPVEISEVRELVSDIGLGNIEVKTFGGTRGVLIRTELQEIPADVYPSILGSIDKVISTNFPSITKSITDSSFNSVTYKISDPSVMDDLIATLIENGFQSTHASLIEGNDEVLVTIGISDWIVENIMESFVGNHFTILKEDRVGPKVGKELAQNSILAVALALMVILIYLGIRFKFTFAVGAVIALFHDVLITLGLFSLLYGLIPGLNLDISVDVVAAFLTLVGYSINDTVVVFDRVRENVKIHKTALLKDNINNAINKTMRRTLVTSLTTLFVVFILLFFGGDVLRGFAFTLFFGIIIGTYSSIFVASPFVLEYASRTKKRIEF
ncbi:MAG: protein translocase subunit SecF [Bacteroidetes bacterium]|nr:protein translocase subunit SecF [Bacteroidota bacterium]